MYQDLHVSTQVFFFCWYHPFVELTSSCVVPVRLPSNITSPKILHLPHNPLPLPYLDLPPVFVPFLSFRYMSPWKLMYFFLFFFYLAIPVCLLHQECALIFHRQLNFYRNYSYLIYSYFHANACAGTGSSIEALTTYTYHHVFACHNNQGCWKFFRLKKTFWCHNTAWHRTQKLAHIDTNFYQFYLMMNKIECIVQHILLLYNMYLLYPTTFSKFGEDRSSRGWDIFLGIKTLYHSSRGWDVFLGIKTLYHSLLVMLAFDFPSP